MRPLSKKRAAAARIYAKKRVEFLTNNPWCLRCGGNATEVHHKAGRVGASLLDNTKWAAMCHDCHVYVTGHPLEAIRHGWSLPRIGVAAEEEAATDQGSEPEWLPGGAA